MGVNSAGAKGSPDEPNDPSGDKKIKLKRAHSAETIRSSNKPGYDYWSKRSTGEIVKSLRAGQEEPLTVKPDGRIFQGNTRVLILQERGFDINTLPRVTIR